MLTWRGELDRSPYLLRVIAAHVYIVAVIFGFPYLTWLLVASTNCRAVGGACGAVALVAASSLRPILFYLFVALMLSACIRRARHAGIPVWIGALVAVLYLADQSYFLYAGASWAYAFSAGYLGIPTPLLAIPALVGAILLAIPRGRARDRWAAEGAGGSDQASGLSEWFNLGDLWLPAVLALAMTVVAIVLGVERFSPLMILTGLTFYVLPTFIIYFLPMAAAFLLARHRDLRLLVLLAAALIPFGFWGARIWEIGETKAREHADISRIATVPLSTKPTAAVLMADDWGVANCVRSRLLKGTSGIEEVFMVGRASSPLRFTRRTADAPIPDGDPASSLPTSYLLISLPRRGEFAPARQSLDPAEPPVELTLVDGEHKGLVGTTYSALNRYPSFPPVLTTIGWLWKNPSIQLAACRSAEEFIDGKLAG